MEQTLGKRISFYRKKLQLTQENLAEQLGVTAQAVSKWENDQSCPDITMLPRLAENFHCTTDELLGIEAARAVYEAEVVNDFHSEKTEGLHIDTDGFTFNLPRGSRKHSVGFAVLVLAVGALYLAAQLLKWDVTFWGILWPTAILMFGLFGGIPGFTFGNLGCVAFGGYFLLDNLHILPFELGWKLALPIALLLFGISLLIKAIRKPTRQHIQVSGNQIHPGTSGFTTEGEHFRCNNAFCDNHYCIDLPRLSGGTVEISFGTTTIDLSGVEKVADDCSINIEVAFGQGIVLVPAKYRVELAKDAAFGSVQVKGQPAPNPAGTIRIAADIAFGELTIEYL